MRIRNFLPQVMYSPNFEGGSSDTALDFEEEGLDGPSGDDFENNDNSPIEPDLDFEPDEHGNQEFNDDSDTTGDFPDEKDSDDGAGDEPDSTETDGDEEDSADDANKEGADLNSLYLRAGQLGVSAEDVGQFADKGPDALDAYLSGLEAGGAGQQQDGEGNTNVNANAFDLPEFSMDFGEQKDEYEEALMKNLDGLTEHVNKGLQQVMDVATGLSREIIAKMKEQETDSTDKKEEAKEEVKKTEKTTAKLNKRKLSASPKAQKKTSKSTKGRSPKQKAADAIEDKFPGEFGE